MSIRAFIAIEIPISIRQAIIKQTARLRQSLSEELVHWVPVENIHLTLKFLGEIPNTHLSFLKQALSQTASSSSAFDLQISGLGSFPSSKLPRLLWIGIHTQPSLHTLHHNIEAAMERLGYKSEERAYSPHLTLGRVRQNISPSESQKVRNALQTIQLGNIGIARVNSVHLIKSDLNPAGSEYTNLFSANLIE